jgi:hypothetical protein
MDVEKYVCDDAYGACKGGIIQLDRDCGGICEGSWRLAMKF